MRTKELRQWEKLTMDLEDAVPTVDPSKQRLVGVRVSVFGSRGRRDGRIVRHECYDTDLALCVQAITVAWDDGETERKYVRTWMGEACGRSSPAWLRAVRP